MEGPAESKADPAAAAPLLPVQFGPIHGNNSNMLRALNVAVFPVRYNEKFYNDVPTLPKEYTMYAWFGEFVVGAICCRREDNTSEDGAARPKKLYIMTLGVLAAWRGRSIGSRLLEKVLENAEQDETLDHIYLHVQTNNDAAMSFYANFGFENVGMIENYYKRIEPPHCYVLRKSLSGASCSDAPPPADATLFEDGAKES
uniref:N-acetyltransferase domain-containing protein n=1 Tax=Phaeomonas parva TaxID=124430 RepID=A0A7S1TXC2_9STRA|mmetsp:Transcript_19229/g.58156  ORF Transcript_19229/g.58156 Transcript_19229/m.58156 type:complete len:200 (+) Transcript_19229:160-759(+)